jgi:hypothetical protein
MVPVFSIGRHAVRDGSGDGRIRSGVLSLVGASSRDPICLASCTNRNGQGRQERKRLAVFSERKTLSANRARRRCGRGLPRRLGIERLSSNISAPKTATDLNDASRHEDPLTPSRSRCRPRHRSPPASAVWRVSCDKLQQSRAPQRPVFNGYGRQSCRKQNHQPAAVALRTLLIAPALVQPRRSRALSKDLFQLMTGGGGVREGVKDHGGGRRLRRGVLGATAQPSVAGRI